MQNSAVLLTTTIYCLRISCSLMRPQPFALVASMLRILYPYMYEMAATFSSFKLNLKQRLFQDAFGNPDRTSICRCLLILTLAWSSFPSLCCLPLCSQFYIHYILDRATWGSLCTMTIRKVTFIHLLAEVPVPVLSSPLGSCPWAQ